MINSIPTKTKLATLDLRKGIVIGLLLVAQSVLAQQSPTRRYPPVIRGQSTNDSVAQAESLSRAFESAADKILPSVVKIRTVTKNDQRMIIRGIYAVPAPDQEGLGSGVIIDYQKDDYGQRGIILTNNHVVKDTDSVIVEFQDGSELYATEYRTDPLTDLAIVIVRSQQPLPQAQLGNSDRLSIGDWVLAVGHPLELETSVSAGIISAKGRSLGKVPRAQFLQTDAAINPGNSGGPLVNLRGEVIGINTAIASQTGGYQGIGFAVPINRARGVVTQLLKKGSVTRGYLGVTIQELTKELSQQLRSPVREGVVVNQVREGTPAAQAGVRPGDVITSFARYPVDSPASLQKVVERVEVGSRQRLELVRYGEPLSVAVSTLKFDRDQFGKEYAGVVKTLDTPVRDNSSLGFEVEDLGELARRRGMRLDGAAVIVTRVAKNSLAAKEGMIPGMIIKQVRNRSISTVDEFYEALQKESLSDGILLLVEDTREDGSGDQFLVVRAIQ